MTVKLVHVREEIRGYDEMGAIRQEVCEPAPDDATRALVELVREVLAFQAHPLELGGALNRLRNTPEGAALIRQAEEQSNN